MNNNHVPHHRIRSLSELRHARERVDWHIEAAEENIRRDYQHIVGMLTVANIARLAVSHIENLREVIDIVQEGWQGIRGFFSRKKEAPTPVPATKRKIKAKTQAAKTKGKLREPDATGERV